MALFFHKLMKQTELQTLCNRQCLIYKLSDIIDSGQFLRNMSYSRQRHFFSSFSSDSFNKISLISKSRMHARHKITQKSNLLHSTPVMLKKYSTYKKRRADLKSTAFSEIAKDVHKTVVYRDDDIVALNKPAGISVHGFKSQSVASGSSAIADMLPELSRRLQLPDLQLGLSLKSFYSGLILLCTGPNSKKKLEAFLKESAAQKSQFLSYLAISVGQPSCSLGTDLTAYVSRDFIHGREMSLIEEKSNNTARKAGAMMLSCFNAQTLTVNEDLGVALVEITVNKDRWEAVETLMSHYLSPVLGDNIYSSRTQYVMGVPFRASGHSVQPSQQRLPVPLRQALEDFEPTWRENYGSLPLYLHRHKITLSKFPSKTSPPLVISASPPQQFVSLLKYLKLYTDSVLG